MYLAVSRHNIESFRNMLVMLVMPVMLVILVTFFPLSTLIVAYPVFSSAFPRAHVVLGN